MRDSERTGYLLCKCNVPSEYNRQTTCSRSNSTLFSLTSHVYNLLDPSYNYIVPDTACNMKHTPLYMVNFLIYTCTHYTFYTFYPEIYYIPLNHGSCSWFYRFRLFMFLVLQIPAFHVTGFTDSGFSCSWFSRSSFLSTIPRSLYFRYPESYRLSVKSSFPSRAEILNNGKRIVCRSLWYSPFSRLFIRSNN